MQEKEKAAATHTGSKARVFQIALTIAGEAVIRLTAAAIFWFIFDVRYSAIARAIDAAIGRGRRFAKSQTQMPAQAGRELLAQRVDRAEVIVVNSKENAHARAALAPLIHVAAIPGEIHAPGSEVDYANRSRCA